jgi:C-terminal processing protease CtpA/Prc
MRKTIVLSLLAVVSLASGLVPFVAAQDETLPAADIVNDEGGPAVITGQVHYTNPFFTSGVAQPMIILEDQAGFVDRDDFFVFPLESQTLGQITSDFFTSPFTYRLALPIEPAGTLRDVSNRDDAYDGVMVFAIAYWNNTWGDPYLEVRDQSGGGWSTAYASTYVSDDPIMLREIIGGKLLVYAPDDQQGFPSGFGEDGLLFTEDDPAVRLPQGYTLVDLDTDPFTFDRSRYPVVDLIEPESTALVDYGDLDFLEAFDNMVDKFRTKYAFTEHKGIDWDALSAEFRPRFIEAAKNDNLDGYLNALRELLWQIPDGHVSMGPFSYFVRDFQFDIARGIGLGIRETDDERTLVTYLLEDGPAANAGITLGAEILEINGQPIDEVISSTEPWTQPFSTAHNLRLEQQRYAVRFDATTESVEVTYRNPGDQSITVTLPAVNEIDSFNQTSPTSDRTGFELPVEFDVLESGYGYVSIYGFLDNSLLTIQLWERMIQQFSDAELPGLIVDMRVNGGGSGFLADQMSAYFVVRDDEVIVVGQRGFYSEELNDFFFDPRGEQRLFLPPDDLRYTGPVAVLVGPGCASACERFAYNLTLDDRAAIIGQYPTAGLGGSVTDFRMPLDITIRITTGRSVDADGNIHIEGTGVEPTVWVPVNEDTLLGDGDAVLETAVAYLDDLLLIPISDGGELAISDEISGEFGAGARVQYTVNLRADTPVDIVLRGEDRDLTAVLRFYDLIGNLLLSTESEPVSPDGTVILRGIAPREDVTVILEVAAHEDAYQGAYTLSIQETR